MWIIQFLLDSGYKEIPFSLPLFPREQEIRMFCKDTKASYCTSNESSPSICLYQRKTRYNGIEQLTYDINIAGEVEGKSWYTLEAYSLDADTVIDQLSNIEVKLIRAWNSLHEQS